MKGGGAAWRKVHRGKSKALGIMAVVVAMLCLGCYGVVFKALAAGRVDSLIFCVLRDSGGFLVLISAASLIEGFSRPPRADFCFFAVVGLFGMFGGQVLYLIGHCGHLPASRPTPDCRAGLGLPR